jgi:hypothetical protein
MSRAISITAPAKPHNCHQPMLYDTSVSRMHYVPPQLLPIFAKTQSSSPNSRNIDIEVGYNKIITPPPPHTHTKTGRPSTSQHCQATESTLGKFHHSSL